MPVAPRIVSDVSYVSTINHDIHFAGWLLSLDFLDFLFFIILISLLFFIN